MNEAGALDLFRESGAMLEGHFELSSGLHSDRYFQCARLLMDPARAELLARGLADQLRARPERIDVVVGPALGAVTWAHEMARALGLRAMFTERKAGEMCLRRGFVLEPDEHVLVVEDVLTTGGSAREVVRVLRELGAKPVHVGAILNRSGGNPFAADGLELSTLASVEAEAWKPESCPLCAAGVEIDKPGSRPGAGVGGSAS
jgi:orotate phosphoribosyltransferase